MGKIIFHGGGFGDFFVCFKALFAIKQLYPQHQLIAYHSGIEPAFMQKVGFIDELISQNDKNLTQIRALEPDIFISAQRSGKFFKELERLNFKKIIVQPHFISITRRAFTTPLPYFRGKMYMADINLKLVRAIDSKHYDANIAQVDFAKMKDFLPKDESLTKPFFDGIKFAYKKVIGINAFSNNKEGIGFNFFPKHWLNLAYELALAYPEFLFVVLNFQKNAVQFRADELKNLRVFVNNDSIASLASLSSRLDCLISIDTGNVHLCNVLQVPNFVFVDKVARYRFGGGGGETPLRLNLAGKKSMQKR